jgi:hypothetical protein
MHVMEKNEFLEDDFIKELIKKSPLESPSDDFVDRVMAQIQAAPEVVVSEKPFYLYLKSAMPYALTAVLLTVVIATSDLPLFNWLPGRDYLVGTIMTYFGTFFTVLKNAFASRYVSWVLLISFSAGFLFLVDRLISRRPSAT